MWPATLASVAAERLQGNPATCGPRSARVDAQLARARSRADQLDAQLASSPVRAAERRERKSFRERLAVAVRKLPPPVVELGDGEVGYGMAPYRYDDCFQAAIATATQTPIEQVPDLHLDDRFKEGGIAEEIYRASWETVGRWADAQGLVLTFHRRVPVARRRWVGVVPVASLSTVDPSRPLGVDHCLVMEHDTLVFDPICTVKPPIGLRVQHFPPSAIAWGVSFDRKEQR